MLLFESHNLPFFAFFIVSLPHYEEAIFYNPIHTGVYGPFGTNTISQYGQGMSATGMDGNRYDRNGNPIDTTAVIDASTVPVD